MSQEKKDCESALIQATTERVRAECAKILNLSPAAIRLMAGEMSAQEMRTVQAVLAGLAAKILNSELPKHQSSLPHNGIASTPEQVDEIVDTILATEQKPFQNT